MSVADADDATKLLAKVLDKMDRVLFEHDLEFRDDTKWEDFAEEVRELVHRYYDDFGGDKDDPDFDPNAPGSSSASDSDSISLDGTEDQSEGSRKRKAGE